MAAMVIVVALIVAVPCKLRSTSSMYAATTTAQLDQQPSRIRRMLFSADAPSNARPSGLVLVLRTGSSEEQSAACVRRVNMSSGNPLLNPISVTHTRTASPWDRRDFIKGVAALAGSVGLFDYDIRPATAEPPPETIRIRLSASPAVCVAPLYVAEALLKAEGFTEIHYQKYNATVQAPTSGVDIDLNAIGPLITYVDSDRPIVMLAGVHLGCYELFGTERVRAIREI